MQRGEKMMNFCIAVAMPFDLLHVSPRESLKPNFSIAAAFSSVAICVSATCFRDVR